MILSDTYITSLQKALRSSTDAELLLDLVSAFAESAVDIWQHLARANSDELSSETTRNQFGEKTKAVDVFAKQAIAGRISLASRHVVLVTEEDTRANYATQNRYALFADPIDGSGHVRYQSACGTFVSLLPANENGISQQPTISGYALYGYQLTLVLAVMNRLFISFYNQSAGRFDLLRTDYIMPAQGKIYSICDSDIDNFPTSEQNLVQSLRNAGYKSRYNGVLVADLHRILMEGGIFISPRLITGKTKTKKYFEALAVSHIMQAAGGASAYAYTVDSDVLASGHKSELFSTVPLVFGNKTEVHDYKRTCAPEDISKTSTPKSA